jgi:hypothetical protein
MLLRPLPDDVVIRLSQTDRLDVRRTRKKIANPRNDPVREILIL